MDNTNKAVTQYDLRHAYEQFYERVRNYLWPYQVIEDLADVEVQIYTAFGDIDELRKKLSGLYSSFKEAFEDDEKFKKSYDSLKQLVDSFEYNSHSLTRVDETDLNKDKILTVDKEEEEEEEIENNEETKF